ncbi:uncharacterized protein METZ01_LOCUS233366 [marine metagenome]|uniref:Uncharacterized protein n=1 Tax=marine metagenome TaxID=408172 RepID=A0A382H043_9ZZZZ
MLASSVRGLGLMILMMFHIRPARSIADWNCCWRKPVASETGVKSIHAMIVSLVKKGSGIAWFAKEKRASVKQGSRLVASGAVDEHGTRQSYSRHSSRVDKSIRWAAVHNCGVG